MVDDIIGIFSLALVVTALGIVVTHGSDSANVIASIFTGFSKVQNAAK